MRINFSASIFTATISVTTGLPWVIVPVLSNTTVFTLWAISSASPDLIRMPFSAPLPVPTIIATGVARPSAQGQEITRTVMPQDRANSNVAFKRKYHTRKVTAAIPITTGTNTPAILSAIWAIGAFDALASSTRRIIWENVVSSPTFVAWILIKPVLFIVAPITLSPASLCTGILSPVIAAWSTLVTPSSTMPSTGMFIPGFTSTMSPETTCSTGISISMPSRSTVAVFGARSSRREIASLVLPLLRASRNLPRVISVSIVAPPSK